MKKDFYELPGNKYITYDEEGDWILWDTKPNKVDGIWMPTNENFNCTSISYEAVSILVK